MYKVVCEYYDELLGFISYLIEDTLSKDDAEALAKTNNEYFVKEM